MGKKLGITLAVILLLFLAVGTYIYFRVPIQFQGTDVELPEDLQPETLLTAEQVAQDREQMITYIEDIHPYFLLEEDQSLYALAKEKYISETAGDMTVGDFKIATAEYLCFFGDGHTGLKWSEEKYLDISWKYRQDGLYLITDEETTDKGNSEQEITNQRVMTVGGVETEKIFEQIDRVRPAENDIAHVKNYERFAGGKNLLLSVSADIRNDRTRITFSDGTETEYVFREPEESTELPVNSWYMQDDIFVIDFNVCEVDEILDEITARLEKAIEGGTHKVIIDARGNGGGNSNACTQLLGAMGMKTPQFNMFVRFSKEAAEQNGYLRKSGSTNLKGSGKTQANDEISLVVLCDRDTFSSATMLLTYVRDGSLGTIIGEPSSNMPSAYGDIIYFALDNSHIWGTISHKRFIRPAENNTERMLLPDIQTEPEEALDVAIEYLQGTEK